MSGGELAAAANQFGAGHLAPHPGGDQLSHEATEGRCNAFPGGQCAPESVEMAADLHGALGGQLVAQLRIAVVDEVKDLDTVHSSAMPSRVQPQSAHQPVESI